METQKELTQKEINEKLTARGFKVKPVNRLAITVNELKKELEDFETLFKLPRLHVSNFCQHTRAEIDLAIQKQSNIMTTPQIKEELNQNYKKLIERLNHFESDCLKKQKTNDFEPDVTDETLKVIEDARARIDFLDNQVKEGKGEPTFDVNGDPEEDTYEFCDYIQDIDDMIYDQTFKLERILMQNKTVLFLEENNCLCEAKKVFSRMNYLTTVGKLFIINNDYFGKRGLDILTSKYNLDASYQQRLTNETIKTKHLKKLLEDNPTSNQIEEMAFCNLGFDQFELINKQVRYLHADMFQGLDKIKTIDLNFNCIKIIDENLFRGLVNLETLILLKNHIEYIPPTTLHDLKNLKMITLRENYIKSVDGRTFQGLNKLEVIFLYYNQIKSIPANLFRGLENIREIYLGGNFITRLDVNLFKGLKNLTELALSHNQIECIEEGLFSDLENLGNLMLNNNRIKTLNAKMLIGLKSLKKLWLNDNMLKQVDADVLRNVPSLEAFTIYNNFLPREQTTKEYYIIEPDRYVLIDS